MDNSSKVSIWFLLISTLFITCLTTANIIAVKIINVWGLIIPAAVIIFPMSYIAGDVLTEVYGYSRARLVIWLGFICNFLVVTAIWLGQILPPASFWNGQSQYERILGSTPRILLASFIAYLIGEFANSYVLAKMKVATKGKLLWSRTIASTIVGEGLDSLIFISIAFFDTIPTNSLLAAIVTQWLFKCAYEALATPLTYLAVGFLKKEENADIYDTNTEFNPLAIVRRE